MPIDPYEEPQKLRPTSRELPPIGVGIDYGTIMGPGAGGARFFGEGTVRLNRQSGGGSSCPFQMSGGEKIKCSPGTLNGMMASNYLNAHTNGLNGQAGFLVLDAQSDGKEITEYELKIQSTPTPAAPTTPLAPTSFKWPIGLVTANPVVPGKPPTYSVARLIGCSSLVAVIRETSRVPKTSAVPSEPGYEVFYTWTVGNFLDPIFINLSTSAA